MSRVINFDRGSKRRIKEIRWNQFEITSAVLLTIVLVVLCVFFAIWGPSDWPIQSHAPQLRERR
jgi:hypothetical protein